MAEQVSCWLESWFRILGILLVKSSIFFWISADFLLASSIICWYLILSAWSFAFSFWASSSCFLRSAILLSTIGICWSIKSILPGADAASSLVFFKSLFNAVIWFFKSSICFCKLFWASVQSLSCLYKSASLAAFGDLVFSI